MSSTRRRLALLFATSGHSGVDRIVANLLPELGRTQHEFELLRIKGHGPYLAELPSNVRDVRLPAAHRNTVLPGLVRYLRRERPGALLTASHRLNRAALQARWLARVPTRVTIRMGMTLSGQQEVLGPRKGRGLIRSMRSWYPRADAVVCPSEGLGRELHELAGVPRSRLHVIPNPIVTDSFREMALEPLDDPWFTGEGPPVILGAGSLEPRKDFATLLRAFARLRQQRPARLVILGEGRERGRLEALATELGVGDDVRLPGFEPNPYRWMSRADAFALTSLREGSGAVLVEALACGTPATSTDCPVGPAEILQEGHVGPLAPVGDDAAVAANLAELLERPPSPESMAAAVEPFRAKSSAAAYLRAMGVQAPGPATGTPQ